VQVSGLRPGDWVVPLEAAQGTWRSLGNFKAGAWHKVPKDMPLAAAATLCINPPSALCMLEQFVDLQPGDVVAQNGATSAVGQVGIAGTGSAQGPGGCCAGAAAAARAAGTPVRARPSAGPAAAPAPPPLQAVIQLAKARGLRTVNIIRPRPEWEQTVAQLQELGADVVSPRTRPGAPQCCAAAASAAQRSCASPRQQRWAVCSRRRQAAWQPWEERARRAPAGCQRPPTAPSQTPTRAPPGPTSPPQVTTEVEAKAAVAAAGLPPPKLGLNCVGGSAATAVAKLLA
jgi:hypothetical protein